MSVPNFEIVVGTYEEYLLGYKLSVKKKSLEFTQNFATHGHLGSIRSLAANGKYLASGSSDDRIIVYDMLKRKEHCMLTHNNSTVNSLQFTVGHSHLVSGSADGVLSIVRVGNWQLEKVWEKAHKGSAIISVAVHDTGKLALTLGSDCVLRTWNLVKGRQAYAINLNTKSADPKSLDVIKWHQNGDNFILAGGNNLEVWSILKGGLVKKFNWTTKLTAVCYLSEDVVAVGHENGEMTILNTETEEQDTIKAHTSRVKCLEFSENWLVSGSSSGHIKIWKFDGEFIKELGQCATGCRITCLAFVQNIQLKKEEEESVEEATEEIKENTSVKAKPFHRSKGVVVVEVDNPDKKSRKRKKKVREPITEEETPSIKTKKLKKSKKSADRSLEWTVEDVLSK